MSIRPLTGYIGGKWYLRRTICPMIDAASHRCYVEPFFGMGSIFFGRQRRRPVEVINDRHDEIPTLFRVVQRHPEELCRAVRWCLASRTEYGRLRQVDPTTLTDVERSARFLVLRRLTFSGKDDYEAGFATSRSTVKALDAPELMRRIEAIHARLSRVVIEHLDWSDCLVRYDGSETFFYLDPPYWGRTHLYRRGGFRQDDFATLAETLRQVQGRWLLSINDVPPVHDLFAWARREPADTRYNAAVGRGSQRVRELLVSPL